MKEYIREHPLFALCGLNCGLCPRYQTEGSSRCPGCGGENFHIQHPTCAVITCNQKHDNVEFCFQCSGFPCKKYLTPSPTDSFISYRNVLSDFEKAEQDGIEQYVNELEEKMRILDLLIVNYNDGRSKGFYCNVVNLLDLDSLQSVMKEITEIFHKSDLPVKDQVKNIKLQFEECAIKKNVILKLRK